MNLKVVLLAVSFVLAISLTSDAFAHKSQVVGDYVIEVGWKKEPVIVGSDNAITVTITPISENKTNVETMNHEYHYLQYGSNHDNSKHDEMKDNATSTEDHESEYGAISLDSTLEVTITLDGKKTTLTMIEDHDESGTYVGNFIPNGVGHPVVHIFTTINNKPLEVTMHPEAIEDGAEFDELSSDGTVNVHVITTSPTKDKAMRINLTFTDANEKLIKHANYDISVTQNGESVLSEIEAHTEMGKDNHVTSSLTSNEPVDIKIKILGIGLPDDKANWSGPQEELSTLHVTPEFGPIVMAMFGIAIIATISLRSKIPKF
ncbi:MAG: hypothetical protein ACE5Q5_06200 [Nitrosarchaeum sp.]